MVVIDALTFMFMVLCGLLALALALFKLPELAVLSLLGVYYFAIFHIAQTVGESRGWYRDVLQTYFGILIVTIVTFAIIYYRYGLLHDGQHIEISVVESIYFSITTWTTLGYGDFAPIPRIRHITSAEAILGYIGLGLWITLISNFIRNMAENRQAVREHNEKLIANLKQQERNPGDDGSA